MIPVMRGWVLVRWLDEPAAGTAVCGGFDGSSSFDWTVIRLETREGFQFTPRTGPDRRAAAWDPKVYEDGMVPRDQVHAAWEEIMGRYEVERVYCDPWHWQSEIDAWADTYGEDRFLVWHTNRVTQMHAALVRFGTDLSTGSLTHDGCPLTRVHVANAVKVPKPGGKWVLGKASKTQHIDLAVTSVVCHEAASDARAAGWRETVSSTMWVW